LNHPFDTSQLKMVLDQIPVGVTVTDLDGRILYYNEYSAQIVDRKPGYIGEDIRSCHKKAKSIEKIDRIFQEFKDGRRQDFYYESVRNGKTLGVTVLPYKADGQMIGFIHSFVIKR